MTLATLPIRPDEVSQFGVVEVARNGEVMGFEEKPKSTEFRSPFMPEMVDASMGIYIFNTDVLLPELIKDAEDPDSKHDFGHNILPALLGRSKMHAFNFVDENKQKALYWRDVGTLDAYYEANMDVAGVTPVFNLYDKSVADADAGLPVSAGEVCVRGDRAHGHGDQLDCGGGYDRVRVGGAGFSGFA